MPRSSRVFPILLAIAILAIAGATLRFYGAAMASTATPTVGQATGGCSQWNIAGNWQTTQNGSIPISFTFQQSGTQVQGTASAPSLNLNGPLSGTMNGNQLSVIVSWSASVQGNYSGTVQQGQIVNGHTYQVGNSPTSGASWAGTGPTTCAGSNSSTASSGSTAASCPGQYVYTSAGGCLIPGVAASPSSGNSTSTGASSGGSGAATSSAAGTGTSRSSGNNTGSSGNNTQHIRFYGSVQDTGGAPVQGTVVATVAGTQCGTGASDSSGHYQLGIQPTSGCTSRGATVCFTVGGQRAQTTGTLPNDSTQSTAVPLDLTVPGNGSSGAPACSTGTSGTNTPSNTPSNTNTTTSPPASAQACTWTGQWDTKEASGIITLTQTGSQVSGGDGGNFSMTGTVSGNTLTGSWMYGADHGAIILTMDSSCNSFTGFEGLNGSTSVTPQTGNTYNGTRVGGSSTTTPPTSSGQLQKLGGIDFNGYCQSQGYTGVSLDGGTINDWHCVDSSGVKTGIDPGAACQWQYGTNVAKWDTFNDPNSWACFGSASSSPQTLRIRPDVAGGCTAWNGTWDSDFGTLKLTTSGSSVSGTYNYLGGNVTGTVSGNTLAGTWSQQPSFQPPNDAGDLQFTFNSDGSFSGQWRYGSSGDWQTWNGTCAS